MKLLIFIFKIIIPVAIAVVSGLLSSHFSDLSYEKAAVNDVDYFYNTVVESITLEDFSDGTYYYKVMFKYYKDDEFLLTGKIEKVKTVFPPYEVNEEVELYINDLNEIYVPSDMLFEVITVTFMLIFLFSIFSSLILCPLGISTLCLYIKRKICNEDFNEELFKIL